MKKKMGSLRLPAKKQTCQVIIRLPKETKDDALKALKELGKKFPDTKLSMNWLVVEALERMLLDLESAR